MTVPLQPEKIILRRMEVQDIEQVYAIDVLSFSLPWSERSYRFELTENKNSHPWVAEALQPLTRRVVGMIVTWVILDEAHVATLAVHPDYRRLGVARRLLACSLEDVAAQGVVRVDLEVRRSNLAAQALYRSFGFEVNGVRPHYYVDTREDALLMRLEPLVWPPTDSQVA